LNIWTCENCGIISVTTEKTSPYSDPIVLPPNDEEWDYIGEFPNEKLCCPKCILLLKNYDKNII